MSPEESSRGRFDTIRSTQMLGSSISGFRVPIFRTSASQKREAVPRRARISRSQTFVSPNSKLESNEEGEEVPGLRFRVSGSGRYIFHGSQVIFIKVRLAVPELGFGIWGLGFGVWRLGFGVWSLGFWVLGFGFWGLGFEVWVLQFGVRGLEFGVRGLEFEVHS